MVANADPISTPMLAKFNEAFGTGEENTVAKDYLTEGSRWLLKGLPKIVMIAR
jgi:hypothetical protein